MNIKTFSMMFTYLKKSAPVLVVLAVAIAALNFGAYDPYNEIASVVPEQAQAQAALDALVLPALTTTSLTTSGSLSTATLSTPTVTTPTVNEVSAPTTPTLNEVSAPTTPTVTVPVLGTYTGSYSTCNVKVASGGSATIVTGSSVTLSFETSGFANVTINGVAMNGTTGTYTYNNVQANTTYTLIAKSADGNSECRSTVSIICVPPVVAPSCTDRGFDFTAAKYSWNGTAYVQTASRAGYTTSVTGNAELANWTSNPAVTAVIAATSQNYRQYAGGTSGSINKCDIGSGCNGIATIELCGNNTVTPPAPTCTLTPASASITAGQSVDLTWTTTNAASATLTNFGAVELNGTRNTGALTAAQNYTLSVLGTNGQTITCVSAVTIKPATQVPSCPISPKTGRIIANFAEQKLVSNGTLAQSQTNYASANVPAGKYDITLVSWDGYAGRQTVTQPYESYKVNLIANTTKVGVTGTISDLADMVAEAIKVEKVNSGYDLTTAISAVQAVHAAYPNTTSANSLYPICISFDPITPDPVPSCDAFTAAPTTITRGGSSLLTWATTNASSVSIDNGVGTVPEDGTYSVSPLATTNYTLTAFGTNNQRHTCVVKVTVEDTTNQLPRCDAFTATPSTLPVGGGVVALTWSTTNATGVSISPVLGTVAEDGTATTSITATTNFVLTATKGADTHTCTTTVTVPTTPTPISCAANVNFSASPTSISRGNSSTLTWSTTGLTSLTFDSGITATGLSGSTSVSPTDTTTYTLRGTDGTNTISCPVTVSVSTGGGGGGSSSPRCELSVSDNKISLGQSVKLTWDSSRATSLFLEDTTADDTLITTDGLSSSAKERLYDGTLTVSPKKDTTYTLTVKRGSKTRTCTVKVDISDNVVVKEIRDQKPLVSSIALTSVPYTGFEAGPILTLMFYTLLMAWALYMAYFLVIRRDVIGGMQLAMNKLAPAPKLSPEAIRPDVFVAQVTAPVMPAVSTLTPNNLPVAAPVVGYANHTEEVKVNPVSSNLHNIDDEAMTAIENHAHAKHVLLSSDAIRHFVATTNSESERIIALDQVIVAAKAQFQAEDGWIVINEKRMQDLCTVCAVNQVHSSAAPYVPAVIPQGAGSLAEAIVTGNVVAAYELIGNRPMFALADAAADLDAVYRLRRGETGVASELLMKETAKFEEGQILAMIQALTGALDGTYTDEASAVKMAIMKAIKAAA